MLKRFILNNLIIMFLRLSAETNTAIIFDFFTIFEDLNYFNETRYYDAKRYPPAG